MMYVSSSKGAVDAKLSLPDCALDISSGKVKVVRDESRWEISHGIVSSSTSEEALQYAGRTR